MSVSPCEFFISGDAYPNCCVTHCRHESMKTSKSETEAELKVHEHKLKHTKHNTISARVKTHVYQCPNCENSTILLKGDGDEDTCHKCRTFWTKYNGRLIPWGHSDYCDDTPYSTDGITYDSLHGPNSAYKREN